jgi:dihydroorotate dehydrogenase electron transfer subunit
MLQVSRGSDPLLKRAFSIFRTTQQGVQLLYRIRGRGTEILRTMKEGAVLEMLGPLGNCYPNPPRDKMPLILAGGIGIASVFPLIEKFAGRSIVFYGARTKDDLLMKDKAEKLSKKLFISTDDGSAGSRGTIAAVLSSFLADPHSPIPDCHIYACGPHPLLRAVSEIAERHGVTAYVSMEEHMACGIGACLGCVVKTRSGYSSVCKEGPVFKSTEIVW